MNTDELVLKFIKSFETVSYTDAIRYTFLRGFCYWFCVILKERFKEENCEIWFNPRDIHFAIRINNYLYDITGKIDFKDFTPWEQYKLHLIESGQEDLLLNIENQCIKKVY